MNTKQLEYFIAVAEELNFTKAAKKCYISQTAVTLQIQQLEESLGVKLFERTNRRVTLTQAGAAFYSEANGILNHIKDAVEKTQLAAIGTSGTLKIGFIADYEQTNFVSLIQHFHQLYPNINLQFHMSHNVSDLYRDLLHHDCDVIFNINFGLEQNDNFKYRKIAVSHLYAILYPAHPLAYKSSLTREDLKDELIILLNDQDAEHAGFSKIVKDYIGTGYLPTHDHHTNDLRTLFVMIAAEKGIAILPEYTIHALNRTHTLITIPLAGEQEEVEIVVAWNTDKSNPCIPLFLDLLNNETKQAIV